MPLPTRPDPTAPASPQPSLAGLCNAWAAGATDNPGAAADNPAFGSLVEAAGSPDEVPGYCADLAKTDQSARPSTPPGQDGDRPQGRSADAQNGANHPGVPPTAAPGNPDHPAGPPTDTEQRGGDERDNGARPEPADQGQNGG